MGVETGQITRQGSPTIGGGAPILTATTILDQIEDLDRTSPGRAVMFREFPLSAGTRGRGTPRIDALVVNLTNTSTFHRIAYEVKVHRHDFERELAQPEKRRRAQAVADQFYFAAPDGLIDPAEVPDDCGLICFDPSGARVMRKVAKVRRAPDPDWAMVMDFVRRSFQLGQNDTARRMPLPSWPAVRSIAEVLADPLACYDDRDWALNALGDALNRHGRKAEARHTAALRRGMIDAWPDRDKDALDRVSLALSFPC